MNSFSSYEEDVQLDKWAKILFVSYLLASAAYLLMEFYFNAILLDAVGGIDVPQSEIDRVEIIGRSFSGFGFSLLVLGLFSKFSFDPLRRGMVILLTIFLIVISCVFFLDAEQSVLWVWPATAGIILFVATHFCRPNVIIRRAFSIATITAVAWPGMYVGQEILIEELLIEPSSPEIRQAAHQLFNFKWAIASNIIKLGDAELNKQNLSAPEEKTFLALISGLVMRSGAVVELIGKQKTAIAKHMLTHEAVGDRDAEVARYAELAQEFREGPYNDGYKNITNVWIEATSESKLEEEADKAWAKVMDGVLEGWTEYKSGSAKFLRAVRKRSVGELTPRLRQEFKRRSDGYEIGLSFAHFKGLRKTINKATLSASKMRITLPMNWTLSDADQFRSAVKKSIRQKANDKYKTAMVEAFGEELSPRLDFDSFVDTAPIQKKLEEELKDLYSPHFSLSMSNPEFEERVFLPKVERYIDDLMQIWLNQTDDYLDNGAYAEDGKRALRSLVIPPISLFLSLFLALWTGVKLSIYIVSGIVWLTPISKARAAKVRHSFSLALVLVIVTGPFIVSNKFSESSAFQALTVHAEKSGGAWAIMAEWSMKMDPVFYGYGAMIRDVIE